MQELASLPITTALELSYLDALSETVLDRQRQILRARAYHDGDHEVFLTARLRQFLALGDSDTVFRMNMCRIVTEAVVERLIIDRFDVSDERLKEWAAELWRTSRLDAQAGDVHETAVRDGEAFLVIDWDEPNKRARFTPHPAYTSTAAEGGDEFGIQIVYPDDDVSQPALYAVKRWQEALPNNQFRLRATFYYPDRIEKYAYAGGWHTVTDEGDNDVWPIPWLDKAGEPLGIPVVHFRNANPRGEAFDAIPLQDLLNKTVIDLAAAADVTAFRIFAAFGWYPTTDAKAPASDGSNLLTLEPGQIVGSTKPPSEASFTAIEGANLTSLRELKSDWVQDIASVTSTPTGRFQNTKQVAAEGTLKQQEEPLMAKVAARQTLFGGAWEDSLHLARKIANTFGSLGLNEDARFTTVWRNAQTRTDEQKFAEWKLKSEFGIPKRQLWLELGYDAKTVEAMLNDPEVRNTSFVDFP